MPVQDELMRRVPERRLIELTNDDQAATVIDTDRLDAASEDCLATFRFETGIEPDELNPNHIAVLVRGAQYYLESWKGRDSSMITNLQRGFFAGLQSLRDKRKILPSTNSPLRLSVQPQESRPDMDRKNLPFANRKVGAARITEFGE